MPRRRSKSTALPTPTSAPPVPPPNLHLEPPHADSDPITASKFPFSELIPNWATFNPQTKNPAIGCNFSSAHHGRSGGRKRSDFTKFELACCLEWIDKEVGGATWRVRCMNVFTVESAQCTVHRKALCKGGPNKVYEMMRKGEVACWGDVKDRG